MAASLLPEVDWDSNDQTIKDAASVFYRKGASPRGMHQLVSSKIALMDGSSGPFFASSRNSVRGKRIERPRKRWIRRPLCDPSCSDLEMLPWHDRISDYPLPAYLRGIVSERDGDVDKDRLDHRIEELKPHVNALTIIINLLPRSWPFNGSLPT